jgi:magnesium transporter
MTTPSIDPSLREHVDALIDQQRWAELKRAVGQWPAPELAELIVNRESPDRLLLFRVLTRNLSGEVFSHLDREAQNALLGELNTEEIRRLVTNLEPDDRTHLFEELPDRLVQRLLNMLSPQDLEMARLLLSYPEESVGRLMTPEYVAVRGDWTIDQALRHIRVMGRDREVVTTIYVTDSHWKFMDAVDLPRLILADPDSRVEALFKGEAIRLSPYDDREEAVRAMRRYDVFVLPVVGTDGVLLGIVTADDVLDVADEEATEDFHLSAAVGPLKVRYRDAGTLSLVGKRIPWLLVLVVINLGAAGVIAAFEETLTALISLTFFIPLLMGSGGNTGAQSATLVVRALATGEVSRSEWKRTLWKEIAVGAILGAVMSLSALLLGLATGGPGLALVVALAMFLIVLVSNLIGVTVPLLLTRVGVDPAVASSPLITSVADISGLLIYFGLATWILGRFALLG